MDKKRDFCKEEQHLKVIGDLMTVNDKLEFQIQDLKEKIKDLKLKIWESKDDN